MHRKFRFWFKLSTLTLEIDADDVQTGDWIRGHSEDFQKVVARMTNLLTRFDRKWPADERGFSAAKGAMSRVLQDQYPGDTFEIRYEK